VTHDEILTSRFQLLIERMRATMTAAPGVGLAAPQIGEDLQLAVLEDRPDLWRYLDDAERLAREREALPFTVLINPTYEIAGPDRQVSFYEGCLSAPGLTGLVARHHSIRVSALDDKGHQVERLFSGWPARIVQHELDHLAGVLYLDKVVTRSLSTTDNYARLWAGAPLHQIASELGFTDDR
jgi:peptide deformylase